jgi:hypothetical protein
MNDWEQKIITCEEMLEMKNIYTLNDLIESQRDWLLGGKKHDWKSKFDVTTRSLILERR